MRSLLPGREAIEEVYLFYIGKRAKFRFSGDKVRL
jgi:hypothetical protein